MNIAFQHYKEQLEIKVNKFEKLHGDLNNYINKQFKSELHTMQVSKEDYISAYTLAQKTCQEFDFADLSCLENYERILIDNSGEFD